MAEIAKGDLFRSASGGTFRLLDVTVVRGKKIAHVFGMDEPKALPNQWKFHELDDGLDDGTYVRLPSRGRKVHVRVKDDSAEGSERKKSPAETLLEWRWGLIKPLVQNSDVYFRKKRGPLVEQRAKETGASKQTIMTCLRLYWRGGMTKDALLGSYASCGTPKNSDAASQQAARGRDPRNSRYEKFQWKDEAQKKKVLATAKRFFKKRKTNTRHFVYRRVVATHFSVKDAKGKKVQRPLGERPTRAQVLYLLDKHLTLETVLRRKLGDDNFENNVKPKTGSARDYANGIGQYFEIDSTIPDIWICADDDRSVVIGKATLYLIVDVFSRLIVGFHLTLDAPSWSGAMEAMMSLVEDKEELCKRWGWEYRPEDWVAHGSWPQAFRADRGTEMLGYDSDAVADGVETAVQNLPSRRAALKGSVECSFKVVQIPLKDHAGGHTPSADQGKRQTDDYKGEATRTLKEAAQELLSGVRLNNHKVHTGIELPAADVYKGEQPIPTRLWQRDYEERAGMLTRFDPEDLRFKLLPSDDKFTVTSSGVFYKGLLWVPEKSQKTKWLLPAAREVYKVRASFHRNLVDRIYVHDRKDPSKWTTMTLSDGSLIHVGKSFAELEHVKDALLTLQDLAAEHNLALEIHADEESIAREKAARKLTQAAVYKAGHKSRTNGAVEKREAQAKQARMQTKVLASTADDALMAAPSRPAGPDGPRSPISPSIKSSSASASNQGLQALLNLRK